MAAVDDGRVRRPHGSGTLLELSPGVWRLRVYVGRDVLTGQPIQRSRQFRGTRAAAEKALRQFRAELDQAPSPKQAVSARILLNEVVLEHLRASTTLAPGTRRSYESMFKLHVEPGIGREKVDSITAAMMRRFYSALAEDKGLSRSTVWGVYSLISGALRRAVRERGLVFDFHQLVTPPKPTADKQQMATDDELRKVFAAARELGEEWPLLFRLACATGMRRGELVALRWSSLDGSGRLLVDRSIADVKGGFVEKPPKNGFPRYVQLDATTVKVWELRKAEVQALLAQVDVPFREQGYVFAVAPDGHGPMRPDRVTATWEDIRSDAGLNPDLQFRALRNWHVTILDDELGFELAKIARRVGHSKNANPHTGMTARYSLSDRTVDTAMAVGIEARLAKLNRPAVSSRRPRGRREDTSRTP